MIRERIKSWLLTEQEQMILKANPAAFANMPMYNAGMPLAPPSNQGAALDSMNMEVWAYVSINTIGKAMSLAPLVAQEQRTISGALQWLNMDAGPLVDMAMMPNENEESYIMIWRTILCLLTGTAYWVQDDTRDNQWYVVNPKYVKAVASESGDIIGWEVKRGIERVMFEPEQLIQFKMPSALSYFYGQSPIDPVKNHILTHQYYIKFLKNFFRNGAVPGGALESEQPPNEAVVKMTREEWERLHQGPENAHRIAMLFGGLKYHEITPPLKDLIAETLYKMPREAIIASFGMPPVLAGIFEYANYANSKEQLRLFWQYTILPMQRVIQSAINAQYIWRQHGKQYRVVFDNEAIDALQDDKKEKATTTAILVNSGVLTPNEARQRYNLDPVSDGDSLRQRQPQAAQQLSMSPVSSKDYERKVRWVSHDRIVKGYERSFAGIMRHYFDEQVDRLVKNLVDLSLPGGKINNGYMANIMNKGAEEDAIRLFDLKVENLLLAKLVKPFAKTVIDQAGQAAASSVGVGVVFDNRDPYIKRMLDLFEDRVTSVNLTTQKKILGILEETYQKSESISYAEKLLRAFYTEQAPMRAKRTAITEMNGLTNGAALEGYKQAGTEKIEWLSAFLDTSRTTHMDADGQVVPAGKLFQVGGSAMAYPSDPRGRAEDVINCHCTVIAVPE